MTGSTKCNQRPLRKSKCRLSAVVADLTFVQGTPLEICYISGIFSDLSPLRGIPLRHLGIRKSQ